MSSSMLKEARFWLWPDAFGGGEFCAAAERASDSTSAKSRVRRPIEASSFLSAQNFTRGEPSGTGFTTHNLRSRLRLPSRKPASQNVGFSRDPGQPTDVLSYRHATKVNRVFIMRSRKRGSWSK